MHNILFFIIEVRNLFIKFIHLYVFRLLGNSHYVDYVILSGTPGRPLVYS